MIWIARIRKAMRCEFEARAAHLEITAAQCQVLRRLWEGDGIPTSVIGKEAGSDSGTITGLLDRLEMKGLIRRERCHADRRAVNVYLTDAGRALEQPLMQIISTVNEHALEGIDVRERAELLRMLARVGENLAKE